MLTTLFFASGCAPGACQPLSEPLSACSRSCAPIAQMDRASDYETGDASNGGASANSGWQLSPRPGSILPRADSRTSRAQLSRSAERFFASRFASTAELSTYPQGTTGEDMGSIHSETGSSSLEPGIPDPGIPGGESEGGKPEAAVDAGWQRALWSAEQCRRGVCGFANPDGPRNGHTAAIGCDGYHANRRSEPDGRVTVRWYLCARHRAWWRNQRARRARVRDGGE